MNIEGKNSDEISNMLVPYIKDYFAVDMLKLESNLFSESLTFDFEEIKHIIPEKYHFIFNSHDKLNGDCGVIEVNAKGYNVFLISHKKYALIMAIQEIDAENVAIVKDFMQSYEVDVVLEYLRGE